MMIKTIDFVLSEGRDDWQAILNGYADDTGLGDMVTIVALGATRTEAIEAVRRIAARMGELGEQVVAMMEVRLAEEEGTLS